jgi:hypothetical protein
MLVAANITALRLAMDFQPVSAYMLYDKGVLQMMNAPKPYYAAPPGNRLRSFYALGGVGPQGGAVEVLPTTNITGDSAVLIARGSWGSGFGGATGLQIVFKGNFTSGSDSCAFRPSLGPKHPGSPVGWTPGWENAAPVAVAKGEEFATTVCLLANDFAYPPSKVSSKHFTIVMYLSELYPHHSRA